MTHQVCMIIVRFFHFPTFQTGLLKTELLFLPWSMKGLSWLSIIIVHFYYFYSFQTELLKRVVPLYWYHYFGCNCGTTWNRTVWNNSAIQCWFKWSGQTFLTRFSQTGLKFDKTWREQKLLRISSELITIFFSENINQNVTQKMGHFDFFNWSRNTLKLLC